MYPRTTLTLTLVSASLLAAGCAPPRPTGSATAAMASAGSADALPPGLRDGLHEVVLNGVRHVYRVAGSAATDAPPVVFLHGGPGQGSAHFDALAGPHMEPTLRMVYFDQRGSGHSDRPADRAYSIALLVEDIEQLRRALGVPRIAVLGHSFGGTLALEYAAKYPQHASHVVFVAGLWDTPMQCRLRLAHLAALRPAAYARVRGDTLAADGTRRSDCHLESAAFASRAEREAYSLEAMFPDPRIAARMDSVNAARGVRNTGEMGAALFGAGGLLGYRFLSPERVTMPALVVAGRHDGAARPAGLRELARTLPRAEFVEFERSGHFVYLDEPERFAREVTRFLRAPSPAR